MSETELFKGAATIVLAGGRSSRMGRAKALLRFGGETVIARVVRTLQLSFNEIVVVAAADQELPDLPAALVRDQTPYQGPEGGMCYGLRRGLTFINLNTLEDYQTALERDRSL